MPTLTEQVQTNIRGVTKTTGMYWEDWHALCDLAAIAKGQINERVLAYYNSFNAGPATFSSAYNYFLRNPTIVVNGSVPGLFAAGEPGAWYDPSDFSTLFQDSAGITPVTAYGQSVGLMRDKSGRGNHASQATAGSRPVLTQDSGGHSYLAFNGTSSAMQTGSIDFTATDKMTVVAGVKKLNDATGIIAELSATTDTTNPGSFVVHSASGVYVVAAARTATNIRSYTGYTAPSSNVISTLVDFAVSGAGEITTRINALAVSAGTGDAGTGPFGNYPLFIGARNAASLFFNGNLYGLIVCGAQSNAAQITSSESYMNSKTGAY